MSKKPTLKTIANSKPVKGLQPLKKLDCPAKLSGYAKEKFNEVVPVLLKAEILTALDVQNVIAFCSSYQDFMNANDLIESNGLVLEDAINGKPYKNPAMTIKSEALKNMNMFGSNLGLDPVSRYKGYEVESETSKDNTNPFSEFLP